MHLPTDAQYSKALNRNGQPYSDSLLEKQICKFFLIYGMIVHRREVCCHAERAVPREISPSEQKMKTAPEKTQEWMKLSEEFEQTLTPEQTEMYHKLSDIYSNNSPAVSR